MIQALYQQKEQHGIRCLLCPRRCLIAPGMTGNCGVRRNVDSSLQSLNYGVISSAAADPIEKKPLYHYYPGSMIFSVGTYGCNLHCPYCQNWQISQHHVSAQEMVSPLELVETVKTRGYDALAFTYSEPLVWFEYVLDSAKLAKERGVRTVMVSNGMINAEPLQQLLPLIDAWNVDLKTWNADVFRRVHGGDLTSVLESINAIYCSGAHLELTTLVVTGLNDTLEENKKIAEYISGISVDIPWHVSCYRPSWKYDKPHTDPGLVLDIVATGRKYLRYVYGGNIGGPAHLHNTCCPDCGKTLVERDGYDIRINSLQQGACGYCGRKEICRM